MLSLFRVQKITYLNGIMAVGPRDTVSYMFSSSHCPLPCLKALYIPSFLTAEVKCPTFYTRLPFKFILLSFFLVSCGKCNLYSKCLLRQYIPVAQGSTLKSLCEIRFLVIFCQRDFQMASRIPFLLLHNFLQLASQRAAPQECSPKPAGMKDARYLQT